MKLVRLQQTRPVGGPAAPGTLKSLQKQIVQNKTNKKSRYQEIAMSDDELVAGGMFEEPEDYYKPPPQATFDYYQRPEEFVKPGEPAKITMRLVGKSPLWGHLLWNAGKLTANYLDKYRDEWVKDKVVLELGAAAALPTLLCMLSAKQVVSTDYPDIDLLENIQYNVDLLKKEAPEITLADTSVKGYRWGEPIDIIWDQGSNKFDLVIMSDLIFNHTEHERLLKTLQYTVKPKTGKVFVVFTPHRPKLIDRDFGFFETAKQYGFESEKVAEKKMTPMFEEEEETKEIRSMVYAFIMTYTGKAEPLEN